MTIWDLQQYPFGLQQLNNMLILFATFLALLATSCQALNGCMMQGKCQGTPVAITYQQTIVDCWAQAQVVDLNLFYSYSKDLKECAIYGDNSCEARVDNSEVEWVSNSRYCFIPDGKCQLDMFH